MHLIYVYYHFVLREQTTNIVENLSLNLIYYLNVNTLYIKLTKPIQLSDINL
jgi:hypothetical protein